MEQDITEIKQCHCEGCGYNWISRVPNPKQCPRCKVYNYDKRRDENPKI